jgi:hypothetical protein
MRNITSEEYLILSDMATGFLFEQQMIESNPNLLSQIHHINSNPN